jgi:glycine cleavage system protein P-like pyridoxal-binding family
MKLNAIRNDSVTWPRLGIHPLLHRTDAGYLEMISALEDALMELLVLEFLQPNSGAR